MRPSIAQARAVLILSAIFWRSAWKYRARCYRYCFWDAGTIMANLLAAANAEGLQTDLVVNFADAEIERLLGVDGEREGPLCLLALGRATPCRDDGARAAPLELETVPLSMEEKSYPDLVRMHQASKLLDADEVGAIDAGITASQEAGRDSGRAMRRSQASNAWGWARPSCAAVRPGNSRRSRSPPSELAAILDRSSGHPRCDFPPLSDTYLIVNAVSGLAAGAYYYSRRRRALELLKPGDFRGNAGYLCLEQPLGADCAVLICYMAGFDSLLDRDG